MTVSQKHEALTNALRSFKKEHYETWEEGEELHYTWRYGDVEPGIELIITKEGKELFICPNCGEKNEQTAMKNNGGYGICEKCYKQAKVSA